MRRKEKIKAVLWVVGFAVMIGLIYFVLQKGEQTFGIAKDTEDQVQMETSDELKKLLWKSIKFGKKKYQYSSDYETYLFLGTDGSGHESANREEYVGNMADFLMLAVINRKEQTYALLQLNRDTMTEIDLIGKDGEGMATANMQLCTAHWYGGTEKESSENTVNAVSKLLGGLTIDGYYTLNMENISRLNHAAGGVTVTIKNDLTSLDPSMKQGETITLTDEQAYRFVRGRMGVEDGENTSRMERQKQYLEAFLTKIKENMQEDPQTALDVYDEMADVSVTNISGGTITDILTEMHTAENRGIFQIEGESRTGEHLDDGLEHAEFYLNEKDIATTVKVLYNIKE